MVHVHAQCNTIVFGRRPLSRLFSASCIELDCDADADHNGFYCLSHLHERALEHKRDGF